MIKWITGTVLVFILVGIAWWKTADNEQSQIREELVLNISDTSQIRKIEILDREGKSIVLSRDMEHWMVDGVRAREHAVNNLLTTLHDQRVTSLIPNAAMDNVVKDLGTNSVRVTIKGKQDESLMTFYVGGVTPDERGTFMLREGSEWPVIVNIPGFEGGLRSRYIMSLRDWKSRQIIHPVEMIQSLKLDYPTKQKHSLKLNKKGEHYQVTPLHQTDVDPVLVHPYLMEAYIDQINHLYAEAILDGSKREAIEASTPFCRLTLESGDGKVQELEFFPTTWIDYKEEGDRPQRVERYYTYYNRERIFLTQHLLMQKIFTGYEHFVSLEGFGKDF